MYGHVTMSEVGELLVAERLRLGQSQMALTRALGVSKGHLSRIESGKVMPSSTLLDRICDELALGPRKRKQLTSALEHDRVNATVMRLAQVVAIAEQHARTLDGLAERLNRLESAVRVLEQR